MLIISIHLLYSIMLTIIYIQLKPLLQYFIPHANESCTSIQVARQFSQDDTPVSYTLCSTEERPS